MKASLTVVAVETQLSFLQAEGICRSHKSLMLPSAETVRLSFCTHSMCLVCRKEVAQSLLTEASDWRAQPPHVAGMLMEKPISLLLILLTQDPGSSHNIII